jgi:hypothetical protein
MEKDRILKVKYPNLSALRFLNCFYLREKENISIGTEISSNW